MTVGKTTKYLIIAFRGHRVISSNIEQKQKKNGVGGALYLYSIKNKTMLGVGGALHLYSRKNKTILGYVGVMISIVNKYIK